MQDVFARCRRCRCSPFSWWRRGRARLITFAGSEDLQADLERSILDGDLPDDLYSDFRLGLPDRRDSNQVFAREAPEAAGSLLATRDAPTSSSSSGGGGSRAELAGASSSALSPPRGVRQPRSRPFGEGRPEGARRARALAIEASVQLARAEAEAEGDPDDAGAEEIELGTHSDASHAYSTVEAALVMSLLPHEKWSYSYIRDEDNGVGDAECRVCLCDYVVGEDIARLPCMHYAHTQCVETWLLRTPKCPVCSTSVREVLQAAWD